MDAGQRDRGDVGRAVRAEPDLPDLGERGDAAQVADAAGVGDRGAHEVDQLLGDELLELPDRGEDLADRQRHGGVPADVPQHLLVLRRGDVLEPEQVDRFQGLAQPGGLVRGEPVVRVVQQRRPRARRGRGPRPARRARAAGRRRCPRPPRPARRPRPAGSYAAPVLGSPRTRCRGPGTPVWARTAWKPALARGVDRVEQRGDVPAGGVGVGRGSGRGRPRRAAGRPAGRAALPLMSHSARSTAPIEVIVTGPRRQYTPR